jgi:hypothetical protein
MKDDVGCLIVTLMVNISRSISAGTNKYTSNLAVSIVISLMYNSIHGNNGYTNARQFYTIRTLSCLLLLNSFIVE